MKTLIILSVLCATQLVSSYTLSGSLSALRAKFQAKKTTDPEATKDESATDAESAFRKLVSKLNTDAQAENTDAQADIATKLTTRNQAKNHQFNAYPPSPYSYPSPYTNPYASPYGTATPFATPQSAYNPFAPQPITPTITPPIYYRGPTGALYIVKPNGNLFDPTTGSSYIPNSRGERILIGANKSGFGTDYIVARDGSTYTEVAGIRYKVDDALSADGERYYTDASGKRFYVDNSGNKIYVQVDGVQYYTDAAGTTYYRNTDGTVYYRGSNGVMYYQDPNNKDVYTIDTSGNTYRTRTNGSSYIVSVNGCTYTVGSGGTTALTSPTTGCPSTFTGTSPEGASYIG